MWIRRLLDTSHLVLTISAMYHYLINSFGSLSALQLVFWSFKLGVAANVSDLFTVAIARLNYFKMVIIVAVQTLYAVRIWKLGRHYQRTWPILIGVVVASGYAIGISAKFSSPCRDALLTIYQYILVLAVKSYGVSSFAALYEMDYATMPNTLVFLGIQFLLAKLYINSFLAMLNARQALRDKDCSGVHSLSTLEISNIRTTTSAHVVGEDLSSSYSPHDQEDKAGESLLPHDPSNNANHFNHDMTVPHGTQGQRDVHAV
ncbi:hypothetical protein H0H93_016036 [Arthromyces matolae]|nr:hypothetical protein H0H93_016036 [Arthromyces matolae]